MTSTPPGHLISFNSNPLPASALHRHQLSLEDVINFSAEPPLGADQRTRAKKRFYDIVNHFEPLDNDGKYKRIVLLRLMYEYALSDESRDIFLKAFFQSIKLSMYEDEDVDLEDKSIETELCSECFGFAETLFESFFLPMKASTRKTPQPTPAYHSAVERAQGGTQEYTGTPTRVSRLRGDCLIRDHHRCVISRKFDQDEALKRMIEKRDSAKDDDGNILMREAGQFEALEVAHILPHSLVKVDADSQLDASKRFVLQILNMFDSGVADLIRGIDIDLPRNALTLTHNLHRFFGDFQIFFTPIENQQPHTYRIESFLPPAILGNLVPVNRTLSTETKTIDPPHPRFLAIHRAIAHILHLSGAGAYSNKIIEDMEKIGIQADGTSELGHMLKLKLGFGVDVTAY